MNRTQTDNLNENKMKRLIKALHWQAAFFLLPFSFLLITACPDPPKDDNTPKRDTTIHMEVLSTFTTTAKLHISVDDTTAEWTFGLTRNGEDVLTATVYNNDTTFTDGSLNPGTQYTYQAQWLEDGIAVDSSLNAVGLTIDTTSHNFVWEIDTLGEDGSYLKDVAIVDENNIWVVGMIRTDEPDTANGLPYTKYNAAHWNGNQWELIKVLSGHTANTGIQYFSENDIWVTSGIPIHWNGQEWTYYHLWDMGVLGPNDGGVTEIWGTSSSNIYFAGRNGSIVHYDGVGFEKIESGGTVRLIDVEGSPDGEYVFVAGMDFYTPAHTAAYMIFEGNVETLYYSDKLTPSGPDDFGAVSGVSLYGDTAYFVTYQGFWKYNYKTGTTIIDNVFTNYDYQPIIVQHPNDILLIGGGFKYVHYNGITWDFNNNLFDAYSFADYGADLKDDVAVITGYVQGGAHGIVAIGKR